MITDLVDKHKFNFLNAKCLNFVINIFFIEREDVDGDSKI